MSKYTYKKPNYGSSEITIKEVKKLPETCNGCSSNEIKIAKEQPSKIFEVFNCAYCGATYHVEKPQKKSNGNIVISNVSNSSIRIG